VPDTGVQILDIKYQNHAFTWVPETSFQFRLPASGIWHPASSILYLSGRVGTVKA
jgi:hypothetical protein